MLFILHLNWSSLTSKNDRYDKQRVQSHCTQTLGENNSGFTNKFSPRGRAFSGDLLDQK